MNNTFTTSTPSFEVVYQDNNVLYVQENNLIYRIAFTDVK